MFLTCYVHARQVGAELADTLRHLYRAGAVLRDVGRACTPLLAALPGTSRRAGPINRACRFLVGL